MKKKKMKQLNSFFFLTVIREVWDKVKEMGFRAEMNMNSVCCGIFKGSVTKSEHDFLWFIICMIKTKLWRWWGGEVCKMTNDRQLFHVKAFKMELKRQ